jgi:hypothetical protein
VIVEMLAGERLAILLPDASMDLPERVGELLHDLHPRLSLESIQLIAAALRFDPSQRPHDAARFADQIAAGLEESAEKAPVKDEASASSFPYPTGSEPDAV